MLSSLVLEVIKPLTTITWLGYRLSRSVGVGGASSLYAYLFAAGILTRVTMPDFKSLVAKKNKELGTYKYSHSSVRTHCESIAFFGGGDREKAIAWKRFQGVLKVEKERKRCCDWRRILLFLTHSLYHKIDGKVHRLLKTLSEI